MTCQQRLLYTNFVVRANDDGFVGNVKQLLYTLPCSAVDLKLLILVGYLIPFESGVCVISDWNQFNRVPKSKYVPTMYMDERLSLTMNRCKQ